MGDPDGPIYGKFRVERTDGRSAPGEKHEGCDYFVLDLTHDPFSIPALEAYAKACVVRYPMLALDMQQKLKVFRNRHSPAPERGLLAVVVVSLLLGALAGWCFHAWTEPVHTIPPAQEEPDPKFWMDAYGNELPPPGGWIVPHEGSRVR